MVYILNLFNNVRRLLLIIIRTFVVETNRSLDNHEK